MSIEKQAISGLKWTAASRLAAQAFSWAVTLFVIRILTPEDYGLMAIVTVVTSVCATIAEFGLGASLIRRVAFDLGEERRVAGLMVIMHSALAMVVIAAGPIAAFLYSDPRLTGLILVASIQLVVGGLAAAPMALLNRGMEFKTLARIEVSSSATGGIASLALATAAFGVWSLVLGSIVGATVRLASVLYLRRWIVPSFDFRALGDHVRYGVALAGGRLLWSIITQADVLIGARLLGKEGLGLYSVAMHLATLPMQRISAVINQVAFPAVAQLQGDRERLQRNLIFACRMLAAVGIPVLWGLASVSSELVPLLLGERWRDAAILVQLAALVVPLRMISGLLQTAITALGRADVEFYNLVTILIVWPACFFAGSHWGPVGLAASWLVAVPLAFVMRFHRIQAVLGVSYGDLWRSMSKAIAAGGLMCTTVFAVGFAAAEVHVGYLLAAKIVAGAGSYLAAMAVLDRQLFADWRRLVGARRN